MKKIIFMTLSLFISTTCLGVTPPQKLLSSSEQLIVVTTPTWESSIGQLQRYDRINSQQPWQPVGKSIPVVLGKKGSAWGNEHRAFVEKENDDLAPIKHEGDGKTPAGIYPMGQTFGFAENSPTENYFPLTSTSVCVDDSHSTFYNQLIDTHLISKIDWQSQEKMHDVPFYKLGAMILYNTPPEKNAGSCIFLHIWKNSTSGTAGCIAMNEAHLTEILNWLHSKKQPIIAILPATVYDTMQTKWKLPSLALNHQS